MEALATDAVRRHDTSVEQALVVYLMKLCMYCLKQCCGHWASLTVIECLKRLIQRLTIYPWPLNRQPLVLEGRLFNDGMFPGLVDGPLHIRCFNSPIKGSLLKNPPIGIHDATIGAQALTRSLKTRVVYVNFLMSCQYSLVRPVLRIPSERLAARDQFAFRKGPLKYTSGRSSCSPMASIRVR